MLKQVPKYNSSMKTQTLIIFFLLSYISAFGQNETPKLPIDSTTNKITYTGVVFVDSLVSKQELFSRAREWFAKTYKSSTNVIQMEDKESGKIVGKALLSVYFTALGTKQQGGYINYTISIYFKEGRYKYEITDFYHTGVYVNSTVGKEPDGGSCEKLIIEQKGFWGNSYKRTYERFLFQMDENIKALIEDLKEAMTIKVTNTKKDDW
jgi:hypothetical protein